MEFKNATKKYVDNYEAFKKLEKYVELIETKNEVMNLTGFSGDQLWKEGIFESIMCMDALVCEKAVEILDIGAGAGFPSIPYAILHPEKHITIMEPLHKRVEFLNDVIKQLELNVTVVEERAEESKLNEKFECITARAVAPLNVLIEISHHLGTVPSKFSWIKGPSAPMEVLEAQKLISQLGIHVKVKKVEYLGCDKSINLIEYYKEEKTPVGMPRKWAQITK